MAEVSISCPLHISRHNAPFEPRHWVYDTTLAVGASSGDCRKAVGQSSDRKATLSEANRGIVSTNEQRASQGYHLPLGHNTHEAILFQAVHAARIQGGGGEWYIKMDLASTRTGGHTCCTDILRACDVLTLSHSFELMYWSK